MEVLEEVGAEHNTAHKAAIVRLDVLEKELQQLRRQVTTQRRDSVGARGPQPAAASQSTADDRPHCTRQRRTECTPQPEPRPSTLRSPQAWHMDTAGHTWQGEAQHNTCARSGGTETMAGDLRGGTETFTGAVHPRRHRIPRHDHRDRIATRRCSMYRTAMCALKDGQSVPSPILEETVHYTRPASVQREKWAKCSAPLHARRRLARTASTPATKRSRMSTTGTGRTAAAGINCTGRRLGPAKARTA